jgi:hypothetical protein
MREIIPLVVMAGKMIGGSPRTLRWVDDESAREMAAMNDKVVQNSDRFVATLACLVCNETKPPWMRNRWEGASKNMSLVRKKSENFCNPGIDGHWRE